MAISIVFNPFTGKFDYITTGVTIPEVIVDPVDSAAGDTWVLHSPSDIGGEPIGLLLALTYTIGAGTYALSYKTLAGPIVRTTLVFE